MQGNGYGCPIVNEPYSPAGKVARRGAPVPGTVNEQLSKTSDRVNIKYCVGEPIGTGTGTHWIHMLLGLCWE